MSPRMAARRRRSASSTSARARGWSAEAATATPKIAALLAAAALPEPEPVPRVAFKSAGQLLIAGPADAALALGRAADSAARGDGADHRRAPRAASCRPSATTPSFSGALDARSRAGSAPSTSNGRRTIRSTSTCARAATRASACVRSTRSTGATRSISTRCRDHRQCVIACGAIGAIDFDRRDTDAQRSLRPRARPATRRRCSRCTSRRRATGAPGADPLAQAAAVAEIALADRRIREAQILQLQGVDLRAQPFAPAGLQPVHRRVLGRGDRRRRRSHPRRAAPVRGLRRVHDGVPVGRADLRVPVGARPRHARAHAARDLPRGRRARRMPAAA